MSRRGCRCQPVCCSLRPARVAPDVEALGIHAADDGLRLDRSGHRVVRAQLELLSQQPARRAAAPRNICSGFVGRDGEEFLTVTLEYVSSSGIALHQWASLSSLPGSDQGSDSSHATRGVSTRDACWFEESESTYVAYRRYRSRMLDDQCTNSARAWTRMLDRAGSRELAGPATWCDGFLVGIRSERR